MGSADYMLIQSLMGSAIVLHAQQANARLQRCSCGGNEMVRGCLPIIVHSIIAFPFIVASSWCVRIALIIHRDTLK